MQNQVVSKALTRPDTPTARLLAGTENSYEPFWSPDSQSIGFFSNAKLKRIDLVSGMVQTITDATNNGGAWAPSNVILYRAAPNNLAALSRIPAAGGESVADTKLVGPVTA